MQSLIKLKLIHKARHFFSSIRNRPKINSKNSTIGKNVTFGKNVQINAKNVVIGDGCIIQDNVRINGDSFSIGDYGTIYHDCFFPGGNVKIGHNFWLGAGSIIDGRAGTSIGNNVGIGAHSQLWTHMIYGDIMEGCRFHSEKELNIGNDVWLTGHNLVSPVNIGDKSMAMFGSLITKDMEVNKTYAGSPAKDVTDKIGHQFEELTFASKKEILEKKIEAFALSMKLGDFNDFIEIEDDSNESNNSSNKIRINISNRTYVKSGSIVEYALIRSMLPEIKLTPS
tara:strand:- start:620 stop:1465 length:846 start_codon:yes stop_codon:yes gene_type:complete